MFQRFMILLALASLIANVIVANPLMVSTTDIAGRIVNGENVTDPTEHPWMVYINSTSEGYFGCGGALIDPMWILTAKKCVDNYATVLVSLGRLSRNDFSFLPIESLIIPPHYSDQNYVEQIALIKLKTPVTLTKNVSTIPIYPGVIAPYNVVTATGWGDIVPYNNASNIMSRNLMKVDLITISNDECKKLWNLTSLYADVICAQGENSNQGTCRDDLGGPLTIVKNGKRYLVGITFIGSCGGRYADVFTRVSVHYQWIYSNIIG